MTSTHSYRALAVVCRPLVSGVCRLRVTGLEHVPADGGFVLCANHLSLFDAWALPYALHPRQPRFMAKAELFTAPARSVLRSLGLFPVRRGYGDVAAVEAAVGHAR